MIPSWPSFILYPTLSSIRLDYIYIYTIFLVYETPRISNHLRRLQGLQIVCGCSLNFNSPLRNPDRHPDRQVINGDFLDVESSIETS